MTCQVRWSEDGKSWVCTRNMDMTAYPAVLGACYYITCPGRSMRPEKVTPAPLPELCVPKKYEESAVKICELEGCHQPQAPNRKYCSDRCRKNFARRAYRARQRAKKLKA